MSVRPRLGGRIRPLRHSASSLRLLAWAARIGVRPVLAVLLGLVLLAELLPGSGDGGLLPAPALPQGGSTMAGADVQGWTQTILARPLFNPDRRPTGEAADGGDGLPRLSAILIGQGVASAIFAADGQKPLVVRPGGLVGGDKVQSISTDEVVLLTSSGPVTLRPQFAKGSAAGPQPASPASPVGSAAAPANPIPQAVPVSPKTGQPLNSSFTAGPYDNE